MNQNTNNHSDEVIWNVLKHSFCSHMVKTKKQTLCRYRYNVSGVCDRKSCTLANAEYATILEEKGKLILFVKAAERAYNPADMWEQTELSTDLEEAKQQITTEAGHLDQYIIDNLHNRFERLTAMLKRMKSLKNKVQPKLVAINKKVERRERTRQAKALVAAKIEGGIKSELLARLKEGSAYNDIYNFHKEAYADEEEEEDAGFDQEFVGEFEYEAELEDMEDTLQE
ncbi:Mak16 protein [Carpediemonas membranifera]|uniref:Protein MAK16 homolog n=1 Tax=Carpediemonas membranifera TaxID=201153 RepID=A0A8J6E268_9EUKA|nr:Mak16 protein [Carpediemonas membranifera]|eukprot:KAG9393941.1 Mak16 protein [Carpediemonas membranifera]